MIRSALHHQIATDAQDKPRSARSEDEHRQMRNDSAVLRLHLQGRSHRQRKNQPRSQSQHQDNNMRLQVAHRSHSPNTTSIAPRMAVASGSMWPLLMKSIACRWLNAVGRILQRYGLLLPSLTRYTPNSPLGLSVAT